MAAKPAPYRGGAPGTSRVGGGASSSPFNRLYNQQKGGNNSNTRKPAIIEDSKEEDHSNEHATGGEPLNINLVKKDNFNNKENQV